MCLQVCGGCPGVRACVSVPAEVMLPFADACMIGLQYICCLASADAPDLACGQSVKGWDGLLCPPARAVCWLRAIWFLGAGVEGDRLMGGWCVLCCCAMRSSGQRCMMCDILWLVAADSLSGSRGGSLSVYRAGVSVHQAACAIALSLNALFLVLQTCDF